MNGLAKFAWVVIAIIFFVGPAFLWILGIQMVIYALLYHFHPEWFNNL